ncbi:MAG: UDP-N-acetylmuramoyl-tripeptide--D-alanyl-D-alanine ligase [candidate division WOR-3 bacterium]|nr:UDP-N-acetylmuramoyl-tripeptide--D-alanyl-D-alanine ligase [candidate division WOR-3 bacterium]MDW8150964.1 UDP-N-acetylmuramoyl-tripeptide--D-alanyl-D-alanine ligase [candidate division WOR-3 bacterium]
MKISDIANILNAEFNGVDREIYGFSVDSRTIKENELFIALKGKNFNGEDFVLDALNRGAVGAIVSKSFNKDTKQIIIVEEPLNALIQISKFYRENSLKNTKIVAVGGASGKTTTKEMLYTIFSKLYKTYKSPKSFNNNIGLPLTILNTKEDAEFLIIEIGTNHKGEVESLVDIAKPQYAIITNIGPEHLEFFENIDDVAEEEISIFKYSKVGFMRKEDYENYKKHLKDKTIITFDLNDYKYEFLEVGVRLYFDSYSVDFLNYGWLENAIGVFKVANFFNIEEPYKLLENFKSEAMRMEIINLDKFQIINDAYNANPLSVKALFYSIKPSKKNVFILGDMLELGKFSEFYHREIAKYILNLGHSRVILLGELVRYTYEELKGKIECYYFREKEKLFNFLRYYITGNERVILKASRGMKFEEILDFIKGLIENT